VSTILPSEVPLSSFSSRLRRRITSEPAVDIPSVELDGLSHYEDFVAVAADELPAVELPLSTSMVGGASLPFHSPPTTNGRWRSPFSKATRTSSLTSGIHDHPPRGAVAGGRDAAQKLS